MKFLYDKWSCPEKVTCATRCGSYIENVLGLKLNFTKMDLVGSVLDAFLEKLRQKKMALIRTTEGTVLVSSACASLNTTAQLACVHGAT